MAALLNVAGSSFDFGRVIFAVLEECEHRRRSFASSAAPAGLMEVAREKLAEIHESYAEMSGSATYWAQLEDEILSTVMPQYIPAAIAQSEREANDYDLWRGGDIPSRAVLTLVALTIGYLIVQAPFIPIWENAFAFFLAFAAWFYPEIKRWTFESRHSRLLNRLITAGEAYQKNSQIHYLSDRAVEEMFAADSGEESEGQQAQVLAPPTREKQSQ